jgi:HAD superfamily hydrolase (TIGR01509 family)
MNKLQAVILDMDGLMVDSEPIARQAWETVLLSYGRELDGLTYAQMVGLRLEESSELVRDTYHLSVPPVELANQKEKTMAQLRARGLPIMPGLTRLIDFLNGRAVPWAVATSSRRAYALDVLQQIGYSEKCQAIATGDEVKQGKPAPDLYLLVAERLAVLPENCLALEDSVPGGQAALAAGMTLAAVPNGHTTAADFPFAHYVFDSLNGVVELLNSDTMLLNNTVQQTPSLKSGVPDDKPQ